ncbi:hypothetical protein PanWU01x14_339860 [Parasponia andersonii]|uniref:Uncharacterized protein n=1 Tax=Parasponia andersonii TaxID=3476 RepID=A0A2P5AEL4_PARAD|nr:hypothetical protein PanWU01x14_339860 [Parasponia andersonii]
MLLEESIHKSKSFVKKTIQNFKSFFFGGYQKLPKSFSFNTFSCGSSKLKNCKTDQIYTDFYEEWNSQLDEISKKDNKPAVTLEEQMKEEENASSVSFTKISPKSPVKTKRVVGLKEKKIRSSLLGKGKESNSKKANVGGHVLAQKMKELEMVDAGDMEQALDIEEALHYYSRLKSPVYLDIVDKFFLDMYSDFSLPQASAKITSSKRRLGSFRL